MINESAKLPNVAVLMATYNGDKWLRVQVDSIFKQKDVNVTLYVSDDESNDGTVDLLGQYESQGHNVIFLPSVGKFGCAAKNFYRLLLDVDFSGFDYVFLADQDDIWLPEKMTRAISKIKEENVHCYASNLICSFESGRLKLLKKDYAQTEFDFLFQSASAGCTYAFNSYAANLIKKIFLESKNLNSVYSHDWLIYAVTRSRGLQWFIDGEANIFYRQHSSNQWGALGVRSYIKRIKLIFNGWYKENILMISDFCLLSDRQANLIVNLKRKSLRSRFYLISSFYKMRRGYMEKIYILVLIFFGLL